MVAAGFVGVDAVGFDGSVVTDDGVIVARIWLESDVDEEGVADVGLVGVVELGDVPAAVVASVEGVVEGTAGVVADVEGVVAAGVVVLEGVAGVLVSGVVEAVPQMSSFETFAVSAFGGVL